MQKAGEYLLVKLNARYEERPLPQVSIVDLREELKKGNRSVLSTELKTSLSETLRKKEQTMLFSTEEDMRDLFPAVPVAM